MFFSDIYLIYSIYIFFFYEYQIIYSNGVVNGTLCKNYYDDNSNHSAICDIKYH